MRRLKNAVGFILAGLFILFSAVAHAGTMVTTMRKESSNPSNIPLVIFVLAAIMVYLCNRPRVAAVVRARRRSGSSRHASH
ncbi:MAG: hypothetical protein ACLQU4_04580 [Limisphaerales bacterium]